MSCQSRPCAVRSAVRVHTHTHTHAQTHTSAALLPWPVVPLIDWYQSCQPRAPGNRKWLSNLPSLFCGAPKNSLARTCRLKPLERLPAAPHGSGPGRSGPDQAGRGETWPPLWGCSLTALFIFNCQKSLLILSSPLAVIRSVGVHAWPLRSHALHIIPPPASKLSHMSTYFHPFFFFFRNIQISLSRITESACSSEHSAREWILKFLCWRWLLLEDIFNSNLLCSCCYVRVFVYRAHSARAALVNGWCGEAPLSNRYFPQFPLFCT